VHFCSHCGRPAATSPPVVTCAHCGQPLPAEANFCGFCGNAAVAQEYEPADEQLDETMVRPAPDDPESTR
jgi:predicted amidophosphoribosyltransferase